MSLDAAARATGAFVPGVEVELAGRTGGPLAGLTFAAKDLFDLAGLVTGAGNPDWARTHAPADRHARVVDILLDAGATLVGRTVTDELAFSIAGVNAHYGTPRNGASPDRLPGGSSSGSASAVAHGLVDVAIGTDTGGSIRVPAAFNGIWGIRPTHGRVSLDGVFALARSFDTCGWFARDAAVLQAVGAVLLGEDDGRVEPSRRRRLVVASDLLERADPDVGDAFASVVARLAADPGRFELHEADLAGSALDDWADAFRVLQGREMWAEHGEWLTTTQPTIGPGIRERVEALPAIDARQEAAALAVRAAATRRLDDLLAAGAAILAPTTPTVAPQCTSTDAQLVAFRSRTMAFTAPAGLAGVPQVSGPVARTAAGLPVGISLLAARGRDRDLLDVARRLVPPDGR